MRVLTSKDGDLMFYFDKINETEAGIDNSSLKQIIINNYTVVGTTAEVGAGEAIKGKINGQLPLEHIFGFCKTFKKVTKGLGFQLTLKTSDFQDILYTTIGDAINVTTNSLYLIVPT